MGSMSSIVHPSSDAKNSRPSASDMHSSLAFLGMRLPELFGTPSAPSSPSGAGPRRPSHGRLPRAPRFQGARFIVDALREPINGPFHARVEPPVLFWGSPVTGHTATWYPSRW